MSIQLKNQIFYIQSTGYEDVEFYRITRSTTNTCEVSSMRKTIVFQNENIQFVEPDIKSEGSMQRCKVVSDSEIKFKNGETAFSWDGKPVKQVTIIFMPIM
jgi:hypothetical protein